MTNLSHFKKRQQLLTEMSRKRGRNVIAYYSGFWQKNSEGTEIRDSDRWRLHQAVSGLERGAGLDLILHTQGGDVAATEAIGNYLRTMFGTDIQVFVPFTAMSAGTIIACAAETIHMGRQSSIGPTDPQLNGYSAGFVLEEFERAREEILANHDNALLWQPILGRGYLSFVSKCKHATDLAKEIVTEWLRTGMLSKSDATKAECVATKLADYAKMKSHSRQIGITKAKKIGLNITNMEKITDANVVAEVMGVHDAFMSEFSSTTKLKIIETHKGVSYFDAAPPPPNQ